MVCDAVRIDSGEPFFLVFVPADALVFRRTAGLGSLVAGVFGAGAETQIFLSVVEAVVVSMVNH